MCDSAGAWAETVSDVYDKLDDPPGYLGDLLKDPYHSKMIRNISEVLHLMYHFRNGKEYRQLRFMPGRLKKLLCINRNTLMHAIEDR